MTWQCRIGQRIPFVLHCRPVVLLFELLVIHHHASEHLPSWPTITSTQDTQQRRQKHNVLFDISFQQRPSRAALENVKRDAGWRMNVQMKKEVTYHIHVGRERSIESHHTILTGPQKPYRHIKLD
ncbi:uncharacterized protein LOC124312190 isoform X1 [Daphnia pulicaria]|uniref:uncharacterized protein LOC124312190 isoform X1 n=1 Tax=Daphnia pulicaria TaxID=35523 RepID=UPI001EEAB52D|nr:uncharacterized protein LOC124312190 isoform X1 [Daphnia pulicaria]